MIYLLDTNIVSEAAKETPDPSCLTWLKAARTNCGLSTITLAELRYGIERRAEGKEKARLAQAFQFLVEDYRAQIFDFDWAAASEWGRYAAELLAAHGADWWKTFDQRDTMIAAIARENGLTVATRNIRHFPFCKTVDPFTAELPTR